MIFPVLVLGSLILPCKGNDKGDFDDLRALELDRTDIDPAGSTVLTSYAECDRGKGEAEAQYISTESDPFLSEEVDRNK